MFPYFILIWVGVAVLLLRLTGKKTNQKSPMLEQSGRSLLAMLGVYLVVVVALWVYVGAIQPLFSNETPWMAFYALSALLIPFSLLGGSFWVYSSLLLSPWFLAGLVFLWQLIFAVSVRQAFEKFGYPAMRALVPALGQYYWLRVAGFGKKSSSGLISVGLLLFAAVVVAYRFLVPDSLLNLSLHSGALALLLAYVSGLGFYSARRVALGLGKNPALAWIAAIPFFLPVSLWFMRLKTLTDDDFYIDPSRDAALRPSIKGDQLKAGILSLVLGVLGFAGFYALEYKVIYIPFHEQIIREQAQEQRRIESEKRMAQQRERSRLHQIELAKKQKAFFDAKAQWEDKKEDVKPASESLAIPNIDVRGQPFGGIYHPKASIRASADAVEIPLFKGRYQWSISDEAFAVRKDPFDFFDFSPSYVGSLFIFFDPSVNVTDPSVRLKAADIQNIVLVVSLSEARKTQKILLPKSLWEGKIKDVPVTFHGANPPKRQVISFEFDINGTVAQPKTQGDFAFVCRVLLSGYLEQMRPARDRKEPWEISSRSNPAQ